MFPEYGLRNFEVWFARLGRAPLQRVELGEHLVQGTDYAYTLQGWLKGINSDRLKPENDMGLDGWNDPRCRECS
jgi:hypothetical protein